MQRLWVQLTLAFGLVTVVGVLVVALLANRQVSGDFRQFLAQSQLQGSPLITGLADYYGAHGDWAGVAEVFRTLPGSAGAGRGMRHGAPSFVLADASGQLVYDGAGDQLTRIAAQDLAAAVPKPRADRRARECPVEATLHLFDQRSIAPCPGSTHEQPLRDQNGEQQHQPAAAQAEWAKLNQRIHALWPFL